MKETSWASKDFRVGWASVVRQTQQRAEGLQGGQKFFWAQTKERVFGGEIREMVG